MAKLYPELTTPVVASPYKRSVSNCIVNYRLPWYSLTLCQPFKHVDLSRHEFNTRNLKLPSTPYPKRGNDDLSMSMGSSVRVKSALKNAGSGRDHANRLFSPIRTPAPAPTIRERATRVQGVSVSGGGSKDSSTGLFNTPRSALRVTRSAGLSNGITSSSSSTNRSTLERQVKNIISTLDSGSHMSLDRTHKRTFSSTQAMATLSPSSQMYKGPLSRNRLREYQNSACEQSVYTPAKKRKVVTFQDELERSPDDKEEEDDKSDSADLEEAEVSEEEAILESKQQRLRSKRKEQQTVTSSPALASSQSSMLLQLECEVKQIQLDNLRKFRELQQQMQVQAKQIQDLQEENRLLRGALKSHRRRSWSSHNTLLSLYLSSFFFKFIMQGFFLFSYLLAHPCYTNVKCFLMFALTISIAAKASSALSCSPVWIVRPK